MTDAVVPAKADEFTESDGKAFAVAALIGGGLIILGTFLPWITSVTPYGVVSHAPLEGGDGAFDGIFMLASGVGIASGGFRWLVGAVRSRKQRVTVAVIALLTGLLGAYDMRLTWLNANQYTQSYYPQAIAYLGPGCYTIIAGAVIAFGGTSLGRRSAKASGE